MTVSRIRARAGAGAILGQRQSLLKPSDLCRNADCRGEDGQRMDTVGSALLISSPLKRSRLLDRNRERRRGRCAGCACGHPHRMATRVFARYATRFGETRELVARFPWSAIIVWRQVLALRSAGGVKVASYKSAFVQLAQKAGKRLYVTFVIRSRGELAVSSAKPPFQVVLVVAFGFALVAIRFVSAQRSVQPQIFSVTTAAQV